MSIRNGACADPFPDYLTDDYLEEEERPVRERREQTHYHVEIWLWNLVKSRTLTFRDADLYGYVDSLVRLKGAGCWAADGALAEHLGISRSTVKRGIYRLKTLKLVRAVGSVIIGDRKYRLLETVTTRLAHYFGEVICAHDYIDATIREVYRGRVILRLDPDALNGRYYTDEP